MRYRPWPDATCTNRHICICIFLVSFYLYLNVCDKCVTEADSRSKYLFKMTPDNVSSHICRLPLMFKEDDRCHRPPGASVSCPGTQLAFYPPLLCHRFVLLRIFGPFFEPPHIFALFSRPIKGRIRERGGKRATW